MIFPWFAFVLYSLLPIGTLAFFGWLALRFVRAREQEALRAGGRGSDDVRRLQEQVDSLQSEIEGIRERQEFVERLLEKPR